MVKCCANAGAPEALNDGCCARGELDSHPPRQQHAHPVHPPARVSPHEHAGPRANGVATVASAVEGAALFFAASALVSPVSTPPTEPIGRIEANEQSEKNEHANANEVESHGAERCAKVNCGKSPKQIDQALHWTLVVRIPMQESVEAEGEGVAGVVIHFGTGLNCCSLK